MSKTTKRTVKSDSWNAAAGAWVEVSSEIEVLSAEAAAVLKAQNDADFLASCTEQERAELEAFEALCR